MSAETLRKAAEKLRKEATAASPAPWFYNSYSAVSSGPKTQPEDAYWSDERLADGHTYDHRVGATCPACGVRPAPVGTYWDCALWSEAYAIDSTVATVPTIAGDTASGAHAADAAYIATMHPGVGLAIADVLDESAAVWDDIDIGTIVRDDSQLDRLARLARLILGGAS